MSDRKCCHLENNVVPCGADAEWELFGSNEPREPLDACTKHVGELLDDSKETHVYPLVAPHV